MKMSKYTVCNLYEGMLFRAIELTYCSIQYVMVKGKVGPTLFWPYLSCGSQECTLFCIPVTCIQPTAG